MCSCVVQLRRSKQHPTHISLAVLDDVFGNVFRRSLHLLAGLLVPLITTAVATGM